MQNLCIYHFLFFFNIIYNAPALTHTHEFSSYLSIKLFVKKHDMIENLYI
jgi:hypothetical protein